MLSSTWSGKNTNIFNLFFQGRILANEVPMDNKHIYIWKQNLPGFKMFDIKNFSWF